MRSYEIGTNEAGQRCDKYLKKILNKAPSSFIYKMMRKKNIVLNGKKINGSEKLCVGDEVKLFFSEETIENFSTCVEEVHYPKIPLNVIYEDKDIIIIDKPASMLSQKSAKDDISANEYIIGYLLDKKAITKEDLISFKPSICNRLDRNTSGLLIAGKTLKGLQEMSKQLKERSLKKFYLCLVKGIIEKEQTINGWLTKDEKTNKVTIKNQENTEGQYIETAYCPLKTFQLPNTKTHLSLLKVHLITGRSHQIRAHLSSIHHPIVGDSKYGNKELNKMFQNVAHINHQLLHAYEIVFENGKKITAPLNEDFTNALSCLHQLKK